MQLNVMVLESVLGPKFPSPWMGGQSSFDYWTVGFHMYILLIYLVYLRCIFSANLIKHVYSPYNPATVNFLVLVILF